MANEDKIYYPDIIGTMELPGTEEPVYEPTANASGSQVSSTSKVPVNVQFPLKKVAEETIGVSLNTKSKKILGAFTFGVVGSLQIGVYESGVSGQILISPAGIVATNSNGLTTFALDGDDGSAIFLGQVRAGSVVSDGDITISGTGAFVVNDGTYNVIRLGYSSGLF